MTTVADVLGWTDARVDVSRCEETRWLGRHGDPADLPAHAWHADPQPADEREERAA